MGEAPAGGAARPATAPLLPLPPLLLPGAGGGGAVKGSDMATSRGLCLRLSARVRLGAGQCPTRRARRGACCCYDGARRAAAAGMHQAVRRCGRRRGASGRSSRAMGAPRGVLRMEGRLSRAGELDREAKAGSRRLVGARVTSGGDSRRSVCAAASPPPARRAAHGSARLAARRAAAPVGCCGLCCCWCCAARPPRARLSAAAAAAAPLAARRPDTTLPSAVLAARTCRFPQPLHADMAMLRCSRLLPVPCRRRPAEARLGRSVLVAAACLMPHERLVAVGVRRMRGTSPPLIAHGACADAGASAAALRLAAGSRRAAGFHITAVVPRRRARARPHGRCRCVTASRRTAALGCDAGLWLAWLLPCSGALRNFGGAAASALLL